MARLIPRKQIEEQQNITGSLTIAENVFVGNDAIISGSLFVSKSFFLGNDTGSKSEITASVFLSGSLTIDGNLKVGAPETVLSITSSNTILAEDTQRYAGILAKDFGANQPTLYVSSTDGDDTNDGRTIQYPLRTIKRAAALASPGYDGRYGFDTGSISNGYVIKVQAGTYLEDNPVILPKNTTIWGAGLRITKINAKNPEQDLFYVNSGCYIAEVTMGGLRLWPDQINPQRGFAVAFQPGAFITTSPYVQNCSQISNQENSFTELYEEIPPGGGGLYVNGDVINPDSPLASMVLDAYTQISPNGVGCLVNGRGFIQLVSFFNNFSYYAIRVNNGGHATLNNSNISFGLYGMYASGSRFISGSGGNIEARNRVRASWSVVVDVLNRGLDALPEVTTLNTAEGIRLSSPSQYPQYTTSSNVTLSTTAAEEISADYKLISAIVENGTSDFPTLLAKSSNKGYGADSPYNILGASQLTSSLSASIEDLNSISSSYGVLLSIFSNGTGSFKFTASADLGVKITNETIDDLGAPSYLSSSVSQSFETIINIIKNGVSAIPALTSSNSASIYVGNEIPFKTGISSSLSVVNKVSSSFSIIYNILSNGTGSNILPIPNDHRRSYTITNVNSSSYNWDGVGANPTITLYRGETYKFYVSASEAIGGIDYPFFIRTRLIETIDNTYDYNKGVINNGDSVGNITFAVPYDAPNTLYYTSQIDNTLSGKFNIINNSETPFDLIKGTVTFPKTISGSSEPTKDVDILNAYEILTGSKSFIQEEVINYVSSSWSNIYYDEVTCRRDVGHLINAVCQDLLYGGNDNSITAGRFYYEYPSEATTTQKEPTKTAVKYAAGLAENLVKNITFTKIDDNAYLQEKYNVAENLKTNKPFVQKETIAFLSSSWSNFYYNEASCSRDVGYIVDAVITDLKYGGNERAREAGRFYYLYPSLAIVEGDGDSEGQLGQTLDGMRYAAGVAVNLVKNKTFNQPSASTQAAYDLLRENKSIIQNETIQYVNVAFPQLKYNQNKCRRDVGYILDAVSTDLLYGGNERSVIAGRYYYDYPSVATSIQKRETIGGIKYAKIIGDFIVQNIILETPRIVNNDEKNIKVTTLQNITSSLGGSTSQQNSISSSFAIIEGIIKRGTSAIPSILALNTGLNWNSGNPLNVTTGSQITSSYVTPAEINTIDRNFNIVSNIIDNGIGAEPVFTSSISGLKKITNIEQIFGAAVSSNLTSSISSSFAYVVRIVSGGLSQTSSLLVPNTSASIKVTSTPQWLSSNVGTNTQTASISSSFGLVINVITNGTSVLPTLVQNTAANIKVTNSNQYISASHAASGSDVTFISASISKVTQIIETGNVDLFAKQLYTSSINSVNTVAAYQILKNNIEFIKDETIAYLSSSWSSASYNEEKCRRDVGLIISGAAEDLIWNANSASIVNGQFYYEYPSQAQYAQLNQTLDGINYASRLAQKLIQNISFSLPSTAVSASNALLVNNKEFIQNETIAYLSSSWGSFEYNESTCKRDVGHIIDAVRTDLVYGGNERSRQAGLYYFLYPSEATGSQLLQTTDGVKYASRIAQKIVSGSIFQSANVDNLEVSNLLRKNKALIAAEVVEYVSSSWSGVQYDEVKCKRDVGYIIDAVRTDLVYGGNERTTIAGEFYYLYPSAATVGGEPSATQQLDPTTTGIEYANALSQQIILGNVLSKPSDSVLAARKLVKDNRTLIQQNTLDYINDTYPSLNYIQSKCFRDVGFIIDGVLTDLVYGGNERSITSGRFYYKYPSLATTDQNTETLDGVNFARDLSKLIAIGGKSVEDGFDIVAKIIESGSATAPTLISNTENGIKKTEELQFKTKNSVNTFDKLIVSSSFGNVINIIDKGLSALPSIVSSSVKGVARIAGSQITSSNFVDTTEIEKVSSSFATVLDIVENGTGSLPNVVFNTNDNIKTTTTPQYITSSFVGTQNEANIISSSFGLVMSILASSNTASLLSTLTLSTSSYTSATSASNAFYAYNLLKQNIGFVQDETISYLSSSWSTASYDEAKCRRDVGLIISGAAEDLLFNSFSSSVVNGKFYLEYPSQAQGAQLNQTLDGIRYASGLIQKIVQNTIFQTASLSKQTAYNLLLDNKYWIQNQTISKINSDLSLQSYNEETCKRDVGYIIDAIATDVLYGGNQRSVEAGKFYYLYPSQATGSQLEQTLEGIDYARILADNVVKNTYVYTQYTSSIFVQPADYLKVNTGFDIVIDIISNGTGSIPSIINNAKGLVKRSNQIQFISTASISETYKNVANSSFDIVLDIVENGTGSLPLLIKNTANVVKITNSNQYSSSVILSSSYFGNPLNSISASFDRIINILENGTGSLPTSVSNTNQNIKVTGTPQYISGSSATITESNLISASISIVTNVIANGTGSTLGTLSLPTSSYTTAVSNDNRWIAYGILKNNIEFIQNETIAYLSSSWSTASYDEEKCRRDVGLIISGAAEDLVFNSNSASVVNGKFYYEYPSQAQGAQLNQTLDGIFYASQLAQKVIRNVVFNLPTSQSNVAYDLLQYNKQFIQNEVIEYISSSWSTKQYDQNTCKRDVGYIIDSVATDIKWGGNERSIKSGVYYYLYPSAATGSQLKETVTGIKYAKNLADRLLRNQQFIKVSQNKLEAKELIFKNKSFIANEVIAYVSASWNGFYYNEETCKRDVGYILDAVATDIVYGGNERSIEAGKYYYIEPSTATSTQLGPTLSGIEHAKNIVQEVLSNKVFASSSLSKQTAFELLRNNKDLIQTETIGFLNSAWSFFEYSESKCRRDIGYILDAVATDILYGGNEASARAGEYYYLYPSLATVEGDGNESGQKDQTLDGIKFAKGISVKIANNELLSKPTISEITAHELLNKNKKFIQKETIAFLSSSWVGINNFQFNEASCSRDVAYIIDNVATDLVYGGNERSSKAGQYYYLYPSAAVYTGSVSPTSTEQKGPTLDGVSFAAGVSQKVISNQILVKPTEYVQSAYSLMVQNRAFIQNETIQFIDAFYPYLIYNREKCRRDVGYIVNNVATDLWYGGNQRSIIAGDYYYRYPSKATKTEQVRETVAGVDYAKALSKKIVQNIKLSAPTVKSNIDSTIKIGTINQYTSSINAGISQINFVSSSISNVTKVIESGLTALPTFVGNGVNAIKVTNESIVSSSVSASSIEVGITTASFELIKDIIYNGSASLPDALANNFNYGFELSTPTLLHISSYKQTLGSGSYNSQTSSLSSSFATVINIINGGTGSIPSIITNTSASIKVTSATQILPLVSGSEYQRGRISNLFGNVLNIVENGVGVIPTTILNTSASFKVTNTEQIRLVDGVNRDLQSKLVSSSFGVVIDVLLNNGTSSISYVGPQATPNTNTKITSSYNLLINNTDLIVNETIAYMSSSWSSFYYDEVKCRRDVGLIISGAAFDLLYGGNSSSLTNGKFYYDYPSQATTTQLDQTITAIKYASGIAQKAVKSTLMYHISESAWYSQATSASYTSLLANKGFIQSESIAYVSSSWEGFQYNEASCSRDIGYIIDAVATDLLYGGNERSIVAGRYYYDYPSQATDSQLEPTLTGVRYAKGLAMRVISGSLLTTTDAATQYAYNLLKSNKVFLQEETIGFVNAKWQDLDYIESKCRRDTGYIIDAVATDLLYGGNERSAKAGEFYYLYPSLAITSAQKSETVQAIDYTRRFAQSVVNSVSIAEPQPILNTANNIKVTNVAQISGTAATQNEVNAVSSSIGIVIDILSNGTGSLPTSIPYTTPSTDPNVINAYNNLKSNLSFIAAETVAYISSSWVTGSNSDLPFVYNDLSCSRDVQLIISGAAEDLLWNSNSASIVNGKFYYEYPSQATGSQLDETLDGIKYAGQLAQKIVLNTLFVTASIHASASHALMKQNKGFIQAEVLSYITSSWNEFTYSLDKCRRDVGLIIDAVSTDILYGGNERSAKAGTYYYTYPSKATGSQVEQTINAVNFAKDIAVNIIKNTTFTTASQAVSASVELLRNNRQFIQEETLQYLTASWSTFNYNQEKCRRDVGYIIDGVVTDLLYGGTERTYMSAEFYYKYPSKATLLGDGDGDGQLKQTVEGINYASKVAQKVIQNVLFVTASQAVSASFDLLRKNKPFIAAETIAYVSSSWSGVYYNQASCSRDVGYLIDAAATDLLYGGTERSVTAGSYYYAFPSKATNAGVPSEANQLDPTITGVRWAGRLSSKVITNPKFEEASASLLTTVDLLKFNKTLIQKETITFLSSSWSTLQYNETSCSRDLGFIIDAIRTDLVYGGNERSIEAGSYYYRIPSVAIYESYTDNGGVGQKKQTVDGINFARGISEKLVTNTQLTYLAPSTKRRQAAARLLSGKEELKQRAIGYTNGAFPYLVYNEASCSRDTGLIVDACATDLLYGGNERAIAAASSYYNGQFGSAQAVITSQKLETLETNRYLRTRAEFITAGAPLEEFGSLIVATGIDYSYNGAGVTFKALPPNQGGSGVANPIFEITELGGGRIFFTSGNQDGDFRIGTGLSINQATGTLVGRTFSKSLFSLVTPFSLALQI